MRRGENVRDTQKKTTKLVLKEKDECHLNEDHAVLTLGYVFDIRHWGLKNKKNKAFNEHILQMRKKIETGKEFFRDLDEDVKEELIESMKIVYEYRKEWDILSLTKKEDYIKDQYTFLRNNAPYFEDRSESIALRVIMGAAAASNAQSRQANSD